MTSLSSFVLFCRLLDRVTDGLMFGALQPCGACKGALEVSEFGYSCTGHFSAWCVQDYAPSWRASVWLRWMSLIVRVVWLCGCGLWVVVCVGGVAGVSHVGRVGRVGRVVVGRVGRADRVRHMGCVGREGRVGRVTLWFCLVVELVVVILALFEHRTRCSGDAAAVVRHKWAIDPDVKSSPPFKGYKYKARERLFPPKATAAATAVDEPVAGAGAGGSSSAAADGSATPAAPADVVKDPTCFAGMEVRDICGSCTACEPAAWWAVLLSSYACCLCFPARVSTCVCVYVVAVVVVVVCCDAGVACGPVEPAPGQAGCSCQIPGRHGGEGHAH